MLVYYVRQLYTRPVTASQPLLSRRSLAARYCTYFALAENKEGLRRVTKACLVPFIALAHFALAGAFKPLVLLGLAFGWAGDLLLIPRGRRALFGLGAFCFFVGHCFYIGAAFSLGMPQSAFTALGAASVPAAILVYAGVSLGAFLSLLPRLNKKLRPPCLVYIAGIAAMALTLVYSAVGVPALSRWLCAFGGLLFTVSDYTLAGSALGLIRGRRRGLWVMATYIPAQALIAAGFALI